MVESRTDAPVLQRGEKLLAAGLALIYMLARLPGLLRLPLFNDEAIYLKRALAFPAELPATLADGKLFQELGLAVVTQLWPDPLLPGRLLSVGCGLVTILILWQTGRMLYEPFAGLLAGLLYTAAPLAALHDRLALPDSMLVTVSSLVMWASLKLGQGGMIANRQLFWLGGLIGLASLVKLPGLFLFCFPASVLLTQALPWRERLARLLLLRRAAIVALLMLAALAPFHYGGAELHKLGASNPQAWLGARLTNAGQMAAWLIAYLPAGLLLPPLAALLLRSTAESTSAAARRNPILLGLLGMGLGLHIVFLVLGTSLYPRYLLPAWPPLLLACALAIAWIWRARPGLAPALRWISGLAVAGSLVWGAYFTARLDIDPATAPMVALDRWQYIEAWPAGYGIAEVIATLEEAAQAHGQIAIVNHDQPRLIHHAPLIYLRNDARVSFTSVDLGLADAPARLQAIAAGGAAYLVVDSEEYEAFLLAERLPRARPLRIIRNPYSMIQWYVIELAP
jgi:hypothetical protein